MKKTQISLKSALVLSASLFLFSCVPETETPLIQEDLNLVEELNTPTSGEENLRKDFQRNYFEKFDNVTNSRWRPSIISRYRIWKFFAHGQGINFH